MGRHKNYNIDEIKYYYENTSLSINQISNKINISSDMIRYYINKNNYIRPNILKEECRINTINRRVNTKRKNNNGSYFSEESLNKSKQTRYNKNNGSYFSEETNQKRVDTNIKKYGVTNVLKNKEIIKKIKQTKLDRYGNENYNNKTKAVETRLSNNNNTYMTEEMLNKSKQTSLDKYGKEFYMQTNEYKDRSKQTRYSKNNGKYFGEETINKLSEISKLNYKRSNQKRKLTIKNRYGSYNKCFYSNNKLLRILNNPEIRFIDYINKLNKNNRNFAYIENDLNISYSALLNYSHKYNFKKLLLNNRSHFQQEVIKFIESLNIRFKENDRNIIKPYELDIYIPEYNLAIECNGTYWHSCLENRDKNYHYNKSKLCEEKDVRLIHIFEYEWDNERQRPILENIIKNALGINKYKLYARQLDIEERPSNSMKEFFNKNNIQGFRGGKTAICLVDKNTREVYMSYMMGNAFFGKGKYEWEVIRGATKLEYTIVGGASRIWNYFIKTYNPNSCVYYIDYNYFNGNSLKNLPNMKFIKTQSSFKNYFRLTGQVKNRDPLHHKEIKEGYNNNTIFQIWNAGTKVYVWERKILT